MKQILLYNIATSHSLAKELFDRPDDFITVTLQDKEYGIESIKRVATHANVDDGTTHLTLKLKEYSGGNIIR